jgi:WD40 repeat protein
MKPGYFAHLWVFNRLTFVLILFLVSCAEPVIQNDMTTPSATISSPIPTNTRVVPTLTASFTKMQPIPPTITPAVSPAPTESPEPAATFSQADEAIPTCQNGEQPAPFDSLQGIDGIFFFTNLDRTHLFAFSGRPPQFRPVTLQDAEIDSYAFSKDGKWLLAYSHWPEGIPPAFTQFPILLISKDGRAKSKVIDLTGMTEFIHGEGAETYFPQTWDFEWVNSQIVKISVGYGETRPIEYLFGYLDIFQGVWWEEPFQNLSGRKVYEWTDIPPDLSRMLYLDQNFDLVLWDIGQHKELWREPSGNSGPRPSARWTPDSRKVAFWTTANREDIQLLTRDGESYTRVRKLIYPLESQTLSFGPSYSYRWSPDSRLLAISGIIEDNQGPTETPVLYVYDPDREEYVFRCLEGDPGENVYFSGFSWSPNGDFLISERIVQIDTTPFRLYDLKNKTVYQFEEELYSAVGWVEDFSVNWK